MPALSTVCHSNASRLASLSAPPVALFVGGTSGIGQGTAEAFARHTQGNAHILLCGRNKQAAERVISTFPSPPSGVKHEFVECDATMMRNVQAMTSELIARLPKINYLVLSLGILNLDGRRETDEGIDRKLAVHYYARWKFIHDLVPLMQRALDMGEDAKVLTILAAGRGTKIDLDDLGLKKHYSVRNSAGSGKTYNDLMIESFAERNPAMAFTHAWPGAVRTPISRMSHWALRPLNPIVAGLVYPLTRSSEEAGEYMLYALLEGDKGSFRRTENGDDIGKAGYHCTDEGRRALWEHTMQATGSLE